MAAPFAGDVEFNKLRAGAADVDLGRLMLELAADGCPDLDPQKTLAAIDRLGRKAAAILAGDADARGRLTAISHFLYDHVGFQGDTQCYYDPRNSYLNEVIQRRRGIPITLAIVYMLVSRRAGLQTYGVATPGHFVVAHRETGETLYVDPFKGGDVLSPAECRRRVEHYLQQPGIVRDEHFRPATTHQIAVRVLRNLKTALAMADRWSDALPVQQRLSLLLPDDGGEKRDLGLIYLRVGQAQQAVPLLAEFVDNCGDPEQSEAVAPYLRSARRMAAELN